MADLKKAYRTIMDDHFPPEMTISLGDQKLVYRKRTWKIADHAGEVVEKGLRYGENPGQEAALYELVNGNLALGECEFIAPGRALVSAIAEQDMLQFGKHPGKTNLTDIDNALNILKYLMDRPACAVMKHNNPSGAAVAHTIAEAYAKANRADRVAAFGGCAACNRPIDKAAAKLMSENYLEVVVAPEYEEGAVDILKTRKNLRIVRINAIEKLSDWRTARFVDFKSLIDGGIVAQQSPLNVINTPADFQPAVAKHKGVEHRIERQPTEAELDDMLFGWQVEQGITSNSVIYVKDGVTVGIGTGEQDRVGVAQIAIHKAYTKYADALCFDKLGTDYNVLAAEVEGGKRPASDKEAIDEATKEARAGLPGSVMISDAFFPKPDGVEVAIKEGVTAIVQPGGSLNDHEAIQACNAASPQVAMVFTGQRAFKH